MVEGRRFAQNDALELLAWAAGRLLAPYNKGGKPISVDDMLGRERKVTEMDAAEVARQQAEARRLYRKIETAQVAKREVISIDSLRRGK